MSEYKPEELLPLSGIQHFCFCRRQWALIHIEQVWEENMLTAQGKLLHERTDDPFFSEVREGVVIARAVPVASYSLGLSGICDVVEFSPAPSGVSLKGRAGKYQPHPVEYKRGKEKPDDSDVAQLCAQAICLEEMLSVRIDIGYLYYGEIRHRVEVAIDERLRALVAKQAAEMHAYFSRGYTPKVKPSKACGSCSIKDHCLPDMQADSNLASQYIQNTIDSVK